MANQDQVGIKKERNFPNLDLTSMPQPVLVVQSPKTPTLSKKLKAISLDSDQKAQTTSNLDLSRDVFSMPNTPKRQIKHKLSCDFDDGGHKSTLAPSFSSNLKKFASNTSISGSQTLKTLPEIMTLQDFSDCPIKEPVKIRAKGLLERRGSNASLTIDLGSNPSLVDPKPAPIPFSRLNAARSVSNLNLFAFGAIDKDKPCVCSKKCETASNKSTERRKSQDTCGNCIIYESKVNHYKILQKRCNCCPKSRRKSLSNENLYIPPCGICQTGVFRDCADAKNCKGYRKACYPRQPDLESSQLLSEDFKLHLQNIQYLQTAGNVLSVSELKESCEVSRVPKLHQEFWEVPLNLQEKCYVSGSQSRNRYKGVLPNEHSRVHLGGPQSYIHANYIKGPDYTETAYIATQGPMAHTCQDFWEMVWNSQCKCIVMLTGLVEKGRNKCELYFPLGKKSNLPGKSYLYLRTARARDKFTFDIKNSQNYDIETHKYEELNIAAFGNFEVTFLSKESLDECQVRHFEVRKPDVKAESRPITHFWFSDWPDHKMADPEQVLKIALAVLKISDSSRAVDAFKTVKTGQNSNSERKRSTDSFSTPVVVHCSAGIGRTGCFLAVLNGMQQLRCNSNVDVLAILCSLRLNRGGMVQTAEQYELVHRVLSLYADMLGSG